MNKEIQEIIDELIYFNKIRKPQKHLIDSFSKLGQINIYSLTDWILLWHKEVFLDLAEPERLEIDEVLYSVCL